MLLYLIQAESAVASREELLNSVWAGVVVNDDTLTLAISRLRRAFADDPRRPRYIETIPTKGYRLVAAAEVADRADAGRAARSVRRYKIGMVLLLVLVLLASAMFITVRSEYGKATERAQPVSATD